MLVHIGDMIGFNFNSSAVGAAWHCGIVCAQMPRRCGSPFKCNSRTGWPHFGPLNGGTSAKGYWKLFPSTDLSGNRLRDAGAECIAQLLEHNDTIVHLAMKSNDIGHVGGEAIARALESNNTLTSLDLSGVCQELAMQTQSTRCNGVMR